MRLNKRTITYQELWAQVDAVMGKYDLLQHPFYQAWADGQLTHAQLAAYGSQYLPHVAAFPTYLTALHSRLPEGPARRAILTNAADEEVHGRSHAEIWRDFTHEMDGGRKEKAIPVAEIEELVEQYTAIAHEASLAAALGAFYAYESQVPRVAASKLAGLKTQYSASDKACAYFSMHISADVHHSNVWKRLIEDCVEADGACEKEVLQGVEQGAQALWRALDGIEAARVRVFVN